MLTIFQKILVVGIFFISFSLILEAQGELFTIEWVSQFGTDGPDVATDIFSNSDGIYVVGATGDTLISREGTLSDAFVSLYNKDGRELWTKQFGTDKVDRVNGVIADSSGVYVVGRTDGKLSNTSFATFVNGLSRMIFPSSFPPITLHSTYTGRSLSSPCIGVIGFTIFLFLHCGHTSLLRYSVSHSLHFFFKCIP